MAVAVEEEQTAASARPRPRWSRTLGWVLVAGSVGFLGWSAWSAWNSVTDADRPYAQDRDRVVRAAQQELAVLNSMDSSKPDVGLQQWLDASAGGLHDQLQHDAAQNKLKIQQAGTVAVGSVTAVAVTSLDERAGQAQVIASVKIDTTGSGSATSGTQRRRYEETLTRAQGGWKLTALTALPPGAE